MVVAYAAGGPVDTVARIFGARLSEVLGQQVIIENIGGAGGMTGASRVAKATPDGYYVLFGGLSNLAQNQTLYKKPLYNAATDFAPVGSLTDSPRALIARKDLPANTLAEFMAYAKANQGKMQYYSAGAGSGSHVCAILLDGAMGTHITHVPYRGAGPAMQDLIAGRIDFMCEQISTALPQIEAGSVALVLSIGLGIPLGLLAGLAPKSLLSRSIMTGSIFGFSLPNFWLGLMLILAFSVELKWLPAAGAATRARFSAFRGRSSRSTACAISSFRR